jgi:hypothetical protein
VPPLSRALLSGWGFELPVDRGVLEAWLGRIGPLRLAPRRRPRVWCELWRVHDGETLWGGTGQHRLTSLWGAAAGVTVGASPDKGAAAGARISHAVARRLGTYLECLVSVPGVLLGRRAEPHVFVGRMYTNSSLARLADRMLGYGFDKQRARLELGHGEGSVSDGRGVVLAYEILGPDTAVQQASLQELDAMASQPLLGLTPAGHFARSWLHRAFSTATNMRERSARVHTRPGLLPGLDPGGSIVRAVAFSGMPAVVTFPRSA